MPKRLRPAKLICAVLIVYAIGWMTMCLPLVTKIHQEITKGKLLLEKSSNPDDPAMNAEEQALDNNVLHAYAVPAESEGHDFIFELTIDHKLSGKEDGYDLVFHDPDYLPPDNYNIT